MSLLRRASSPIRNFGKEKNALMFELVFHQLDLSGRAAGKHNKQKCWVKWVRTSKSGQTKKKVTISNGMADMGNEKVKIDCTCHYTDEAGYEPKSLGIEVYTRSVKDKTEMLGSFECNLTDYALEEHHPDLEFAVNDNNQAEVGTLLLSMNCTFIDGKGRQPKNARLSTPRRGLENGSQSPSSGRGGRSLNSSPSPSLGPSEPSGTPRSSAAMQAHRRQQTPRGDMNESPRGAQENGSQFPRSPQTASGKTVARVYFSDGTYTSTVVRPNQTAAFVSQQVRNRRAVGGAETLPEGEVLEEMRLHEAVVHGRTIRQLHEEELVAEVMSGWSEEEDAFLIFMMPTVPVEIGSEMTSLEDMDDETETNYYVQEDLDEDEEEDEDEEQDEEDEEEEHMLDSLPVINGQDPEEEYYDEDEEEEYDEEDEDEEEIDDVGHQDQVQDEEESDEESEPEDSGDAETELEEAKAREAVMSRELAESYAKQKAQADELERLQAQAELLKNYANNSVGDGTTQNEPKPSQATKGACGGCVIC